MKTRICLFSLVAVVLLGTSTFADGPFDKFLPRGRLLKKLRDDIMGEPAPKQPTPAAKPNQAAKKGPTPATRPPAQLRSQPSQNVNADRPAAVRSGADGFGMAIVVDKNENLVVAQVSANGNAAEAGIRRGDVLVEAGGVELTSIEEFEEIEKILGAGDQVELKVARNGRAAKVMLQHGQAPSLEDVENGKVGAQANTASRSQGYQPSSSSREDFSFVPPSDENGSSSMRSVIDRPAAPVRPVSTQKPALSQLQSNYRPQAPRPRQQSASAQQQQEIQLLRRQLEQLRRQQSLIGSGVQPR
jgi:membrane-associated protease RseP (regulator of RpoE activity)